jgi:beta-glucanase (GH16 family)
MKIYPFLFFVVLLFLAPVRSMAQCNELVWADEFDQAGLPDSTRWSYEVGGGGWGNSELEYYTDKRAENARVENGKLIIEAIKESYQGSTYTSARLVSKLKGDWLNGTVEARAKLPGGKGTWAAIWMLSTDQAYGSWPSSGEIDIMEYVGYDVGKIYGTIHTEAYNHTLGTQKGGNTTLTDETDTFHVYKMTWTQEKIEFYVDNTKYYTFNNPHIDYTTWPFDKRFHLIMNLAVGGSWGGSQGVDPTVFPARMEVDYVRVYQDSQNLAIHGPEKVFPMQEDVHFFLYRDQEASYSWSLKGDGEFTSPTNSSEGIVRWGCKADTILCHVTTACSEYDLVYPVGIDGYAIDGPMFVEPLQENILLKAPALSGSTYTWTVPADATISAGQGNDSLYCSWGENPGIVSLVIANECGTDSIDYKLRFYGQYAYPDPDVPHTIPGVINATDYDYGGEGVSYHDTETANQGAGPREEEGVDTEYGDNGTANVGWISSGEWLEYGIHVTEDENYDAALRVASNNSTRGPLRMLINGEERIGDIDLPSTGSWSVFTTVVIRDIPFYTTDTLMRMEAGTGGFNLGNITIATDIPDAVKEIPQGSVSVYPNPASGNVTIRSDRTIQQVIIRDMAGKTLMVAGPFPQAESAELPVSGYKPGLYFIHVRFDDMYEETGKIVLW